jgi:hypothetical protein
MTRKEAARIAGVDVSTITRRMQKGYSLREAMGLGGSWRGLTMPKPKRFTVPWKPKLDTEQ